MAEVASLMRHERWTKGGPVNSRLPEEEIESLEDRAGMAVADPAPLGLWGFATGTWIAGTIIGGAFPAGAITNAIPVLLVFAGLVQFIAGLFAFRRGNILSATAFCCFGSFNVMAAGIFALQARGFLASTGDAVVLTGFLLESFAFIALALTLAALPTNAALVLTLGTLAVGYALAGIPDLANAGTGGWAFIGHIGGWFLVASAVCAYYTGTAVVVNSVWGRTVLPVWGEP